MSGFPGIHFSPELSAQIQREQNVLAAMRFTDVTPSAGLNFSMQPEEHRLAQAYEGNLALGDLRQAERITLFLNGWIFPTDASSNAALSQTDRFKVVAPHLQVLDRHGRWHTVIENLSFPSRHLPSQYLLVAGALAIARPRAAIFMSR